MPGLFLRDELDVFTAVDVETPNRFSRSICSIGIVRVDEDGERIPLTISAVEGDRVRVIFMAVGATTHRLAELVPGDAIRDVAGPLGRPSEIPSNETCVVVGGGAGIAS